MTPRTINHKNLYILNLINNKYYDKAKNKKITNLAITTQWYATMFYFKSDTCQQMGLANFVALSATTYILMQFVNY